MNRNSARSVSVALVSATLALVAMVSVPQSVLACSQIVYKSPDGKYVIVGRNMDWSEQQHTNLWILPRGVDHEGLTAENPLRWKSKYGSTVVGAYDIGACDGVNEKGLTGNLLFLAESDYGKRDTNLPGVSLSLWLEFYLDNFATVGEAIAYTHEHPFQARIVSVNIGGQTKDIRLHLSLADRSGDSAVLEYIDGKLVVFHGPQFNVMTNSPTYDKQLEGLKDYKGFGGDKPLPGSTIPAERFVRAATYVAHLPNPSNQRAAIAAVLSVMRNVSQPIGETDPDRPYISPTIWRTVADLTHGLYFYESTTSPNVIWVDLNKIDFADLRTRKLTLVDQPDRTGDVTSQFQITEPFKPAHPDPEN